MIAVDKIPLVDLHRQYASIREEIQEAIDRVLEKADFIMGDSVAIFEDAFAAYCQAQYCIGVASGTAALQLALHALGIGPGDEVITVSHTFFATGEAISLLGARPVFVEVDAATLTLDASKLEAAITPKTKAIIPVHIYGQCADMTSILEIANRHNIPVVEDAAQAHGAQHAGRRAGTMGIMGCFSFYPGKNLGAYGDAGAIVTNDAALADRLRRLRNHGRTEKYEHVEVGYGERLDTLQAAILNVKLKHLNDWTEQRRHWAAYYTLKLTADLPGLILPSVREGDVHVFHLYVIQHPQRDRLASLLKQNNVSTGIHYPIPLHLQPAYASLGYKIGDFPITEQKAATILSLPLFPEMTEVEADHIIGAVRTFCLENLEN